jgi:membrane-associated protease RseP (regulator of RpoE activity)
VADTETASCTVHGYETDPDTGPPPRIGALGVIVCVVLSCLAFLYARPHDRMLKLLAAALIIMPVHIVGFVLAGYVARARMLRVIVYYAGTVVRGRVGQTWVGIGWLPMGGYVKFAGQNELRRENSPEPGTWPALHPVCRTAIVLSGPALLLVFACTIVGPRVALSEAAEVPRQSIQALSGKYPDLMRGFFRFVDSADARLVIGIMAAKVGVLNLFPIPILNGGQALIEAAQGLARRPLPQRVLSVLQLIGLFGVLAFFLYSICVLPSAWRAAAS